jgi:hypothetical protein
VCICGGFSFVLVGRDVRRHFTFRNKGRGASSATRKKKETGIAVKLRKRLEEQQKKQKKQRKGKKQKIGDTAESAAWLEGGDPLLLDVEQFGILPPPYVVIHPRGTCACVHFCDVCLLLCDYSVVC